PAEQTLFTRLAVFVGGCTLAAAEMLCGADATLTPSLPFSLSPPQVLDGIASLLDKSLLHREISLHGEPRYILLETVREYGLEQLALSGQEAMLRQRHTNCCLRMIEKAEQTDFSRFRMQLRRQIDTDIHNLRAAHSWAIEQDSQAALLIAAALVNWLGARGPFEEGRLLIATTLASPGASAHTIPRAKMLFEAGLMLAHQDPDQAQAFQEESLALSQELGYVKGEADALTGLGRIGFSGLNDLSAAQRYLERALPIYRELHDLGGIAYATDRLATIAFNRADYSLAGVLANECLAIAQQSGFLNSWALLILGNIAYAYGDLVEARSRWEQALVLMDSKGVMADTLAWMGVAASIQGDFPAAHAFLDESRSLWRSEYSEEYARVLVAPHTALLFQTKGDYETAVRWYRASLPGLEREVDTWDLCGLGLAALAAALDQHEMAARMLGATDAVDQEDRRLHPFERDDYNRLADVARASLGAAAFDVAWAQGRAASFEAAVEETVSILEATLAVRGQLAPT
ncbi:MAG: tetratricopeptide repeat protein, partial [Anaerolineae bacterium]